MANKELIEEVGKYIDKYYEPGTDDIKMDKEMKSIFDKITDFRQRRKEQKKQEAPADYKIDMSAPAEFDVGSMKKKKITKEMSQTMATNRNIDDLMNQMEETFSERLLRLIDERGMTDSEAYTKANVDRRHFSKIRKDVNYAPNKKTVLAFTIALELSLDEAKDLLRSAGFALSRSSKTDIIVAYFLQNKIYDMFEINDVLYAYGQVLLNHVGLLIVDEIQNVVHHRNGRQLVAMLTQLINSSGISICMVGTPEVEPFFSSVNYLARRTLGLKYDSYEYGEYFEVFCRILFQYQYVKEETVLTEKMTDWGLSSKVCKFFFTPLSAA